MTSGMALGDYIRTRRKQLGLSVSEAARRANVHRVTWNSWESGKSEPGDYNHAAIESVLQWQAGGMDRLGRGEKPVLVEPSAPSSAAERQVDEAERRILAATNVELVEMFRAVESAPGITRAFAGQWLVDALDMRDRARQRREATKRDVS